MKAPTAAGGSGGFMPLAIASCSLFLGSEGVN